MSAVEEAVVLECAGDALVGVLHRPGGACIRALVLIVGGPQYRVGSHRQFVLLARALAEAGTLVLRFDYRGMGDSGGEPRTFEDIANDIRCAVDYLFALGPAVQEVVLWGLCDAASAAMMYGASDRRVRGLALLNPWVRTDATLARAQLQHYYSARMRDTGRWLALMRNPRKLGAALASYWRTLRTSRSGEPTAPSAAGERPFTERMRSGLDAFSGPVLLVLSGQDLTAREFDNLVKADRGWQSLLERPATTLRRLEEADHTFSTRDWCGQVSAWTAQWLRSW